MGRNKATALIAAAIITVTTIMVFRRMAIDFRNNRRNFAATKWNWSSHRDSPGVIAPSFSYFIGNGKQANIGNEAKMRRDKSGQAAGQFSFENVSLQETVLVHHQVALDSSTVCFCK
jgi:hypothetical protein